MISYKCTHRTERKKNYICWLMAPIRTSTHTVVVDSKHCVGRCGSVPTDMTEECNCEHSKIAPSSQSSMQHTLTSYTHMWKASGWRAHRTHVRYERACRREKMLPHRTKFNASFECATEWTIIWVLSAVVEGKLYWYITEAYAAKDAFVFYVA